MTLDPTPPGIHPIDAMLLLLGDVRSDADASALVEELRLDQVAGSLSADDPFDPVLVANAWTHLGSCDRCLSRRRALLGEVAPAIASSPLRSAGDTNPPGSIDARVRAALGELVPSAAALPESLARPSRPRRRWLAPRGSAGIGTTSGHGGAIARPWVFGVAAAALLLAVGAAFLLRPRTTEQSAVGTVPPSVDRATPSDTTSGEKSLGTGTEAMAAESEQGITAGAMADEPAASPPATEIREAAAPLTNSNSGVDERAPSPAPPETAASRATDLPVQPSPARASSKATDGATGVASEEASPSPIPPPPAKKKSASQATAGAAVPAASAAAVPAPPASEVLATAELGDFADAASALDRFGARATASTDAAAAQLGQPSAAAPANAAAPRTSPLSAPAPSPEPALCGSVTGTSRLRARIGDRDVVMVRTGDPSTPTDVVLDASTCAELARRAIQASTAPTTTTLG